MDVNLDSYDEETRKFIEGHPALMDIQRRSTRLQELENTIETAPNDEEKIYRLERYRDMAKHQYRKVVELFTGELQKDNQAWEGLLQKATESLDVYEKQCQKLVDALQNERNEHNKFYDNLCLSFLVKPRGTFEEVLRQVERMEKAENQDGLENWQWSLNFHFFARLRVAWDLVFGE